MKNTMNALSLHTVGDIRYEEVAMPVRRPDEVLMRVRACGICGSDLPRIFTKGTYRFPTIPGHEFAGDIVDADDPSLIGRRAAVFPLLPCFECEACRAGNYAQCSDYDYYGSRRDGAFAEYIAVKTWNLVFFDNPLSHQEAAMCEPAAVALHAIGKADMAPGNTVAIFGAGPIGVMLGLWARLNGGGAVILCDIDPTKVEFARRMGFDAVDSRQEDAVEYIRRSTAGRGADVCIEGVGASQTWQQCLGAASNGGTVICMGNPAGDMTLTQKEYWEILRKELTLKGTWNSSYNDRRNDWNTALAAIADRRIDVRPLISHRFDLSEAGKAFSIMRERREFFNKVMFVNE